MADVNMKRRLVCQSIAWMGLCAACGYGRVVLGHAGADESSDALAPLLRAHNFSVDPTEIAQTFDQAPSGL